MAHYWISKSKNFGKDVKFGDEIKGLDPERAKALIGQKLVSTKKPESITSAEKNALVEIQEANKDQKEEIQKLKSEIKELKEQLEEATKPKGK